MALKGLDIFKLSPKKNCKECGSPTCMAFCMKVAQGAVELDKCPYFSEEAKAKMSEASAPPMKTIKVGVGDNEITLGGETVLMRHEKTFVNKSIYAVAICDSMDDAAIDATLAEIPKVDYVRIGERMRADMIYVNHDETSDAAKYVAVVKKVAALDKAMILNCPCPDTAKEALAVCKDCKPILNGANASNYEAMNGVAVENGVVLGVTGETMDEIYDTVAAVEALGNKNLVIDVGVSSIKSAFANAVQIRRAALKDGERTLGYPSIVNVAYLAHGDSKMQAALASMFTMKYGSIIVMEHFGYAEALALCGLRQNIFTDPQKPMKVEPGIYALNGADENSVCAITVDFALTYFVVSGEIERSGVPVNMLITDAGGLSVLTAWAAGKLSASSIAKFFQEQEIEGKVKNRTLIIPGKVAVLKGEIEQKLPGWNIIVGTNEAVQLVQFLKDYK